MSYIDFNHENNSILVCKGDAKNRNKIKVAENHEEFSEYALEDEFAGIELTNFLTQIEKDGVKGELVERLVRWGIHPEDLVTHRFTLDDVAKAYDLMDQGRCGKVAVVYDEEVK